METDISISQYPPDFLTKLLSQMLLIRLFEQKAAQMYGIRKIGGFCHLYIGQEAVCTGAVAAIDPAKDYVITAYRDHGHALVMGIDPKIIMAELFGKAAGCSRGKGGSMHLFDAAKHFYGGHGIVGSHIPLAAGIALKIKYLAEHGVVLCFFGDGAVHQGSFHETLNISRVWNLPVVYICENNQYGMGTDYRRVSAVADFSKLAASYDIPGRQLDGMNALEVYKNVLQAVELARTQSIPTLLEIKTYRYMGHSMTDAATYRTKEELEQFRRQDPILILKNTLLQQNIITEDQYAQLEQQHKQTVADAVDFAEKSDEPKLETLYEDLLV